MRELQRHVDAYGAAQAWQRALALNERTRKLAARLSRALTRDDVLRAAVDESAAILQLRNAGLFRLDEDALVLEHSVGYDERFLELFARMPLDSEYPVVECVRRRQPIFFGSRGEYRSAMPRAEATSRAVGTPAIAFACLPLVVEAEVIGVIALTLGVEHQFVDDERAFLELLATLSAHALERARLLADVRTSSETLDAVVRACPAGVMLLDGDGTVRLWNPAAERIFGWSAAEVVGRLLPTVPPELWPQFREGIARVLDGATLEGVEAPRRRRDGSAFDASVWAAPVERAGGERQSLAVVFDISARKRVERSLVEAEARYRRVFETTPIGLGAWRGDTLVEANDALLALLGETREALLGGAIAARALLGEERLPTAVAAAGGLPELPPPVEREVLRRDGERVPVLVGGSRWDGTDDAGVLFAVDVAEERRLLAAERRARARLVRIQEATAALSRARTAAEVAETACRLGAESMEARSGALWIADDRDRALHLAGAWGTDAAFMARFGRIPFDSGDAPAAMVLRTGAPVWVSTEAEYARIAPGIHATAQAARRVAAFAAVPLLLDGRVSGVITFAHPLGHLYDGEARIFYATLATHCAQALERARLLDVERRANERLRVLSAVGEAFAATLDEELALRTLVDLAVPEFADWGSVHLVEGDLLRRVAGRGSPSLPPALHEALSTRDHAAMLHGDDPLVVVARTGATLWRSGMPAAEFESYARSFDERAAFAGATVRSVVCAAIVADGASIGVIALSTFGFGQPLTDEDRQFVEELARRAGLAIANARRFHAVERAHARITELQRFSSAMAQAATTRDVATVAAEHGVRLLGARAAMIFALDPHAARLRVIGHHDAPEDWLRCLDDIPLDAPFPAAVAARTRQAVWIESERTFAARFPDVARDLRISRTAACAPLLVEDTLVGVISFAFGEERGGPPDERALLGTMADQTAQALARARLLDRARDAGERLALLAHVGEALAEAADDLAMRRRLLDLILPRLGDYGALETARGDEVERIVHAVDDEAAQRSLERDYLERLPLDESALRGVSATRTGRARLIPYVGEAEIAELAVDEAHRENMRRRRLCSLLSVPVVARGRTLGALVLAYGSSGRHFTTDDLALAEEIGRRAGAAIERGQLHRASEEAARAAHEAARRAEEANRIKDEFLATVSHELRTPLNAIHGWGALLAGRTDDAARVARGLGVIRRNSEALVKLVDDILDVSRIVAGKLKIAVAPLDLAAIAREALDVVRPSAEARRLELDLVVDGDCRVVGDAQRLQQVMWNLLSNAVKFTEPGGRVRVTVERQRALVVATVEDNGRGITPEFLPYVFDRFRQADSSTTRRFGGLGLGLALVRHIVELHGGAVSVESEGPGRGTRFRVELPTRVLSAPPLRDAERASDQRTLDGLRVLVLDDDGDARELLAAVLEGAGATVLAAATTADALAALDGFRPGVVLSDIAMPGADGYAFVSELRARSHERGGATPAIALTAYARSEDRERALAAGFDEHMAKPVDPTELVDALARHRRPPG